MFGDDLVWTFFFKAVFLFFFLNSKCNSSLLGDKLDVHAGGVDLKFPHHENEIAQCTAHYNLHPNQRWPRYFLHTGRILLDHILELIF